MKTRILVHVPKCQSYFTNTKLKLMTFLKILYETNLKKQIVKNGIDGLDLIRLPNRLFTFFRKQKSKLTDTISVVTLYWS